MPSLSVTLAEHRHLTGERISLRPISLEDAADMTEYASDEETTRYIFAEPKNLEQTERLIAGYYMREPIGKYAVVLNDGGKLELQRVHAAHEAANEASGRLMLRLGMTCEGIRRRDQLSRGQLVDSVYYSILSEEYQAARR